MKIQHTNDSPILLKITPESVLESFKLGILSESLRQVGVNHRSKDNGVLLINIDPAGWEDFEEHGGD